MSIKIGLLHEKKRTQNTKGPDVACGWSLILLAGGVKQDSALLGREGEEEQKGLILHDLPCIIPILLTKTPKHTTAPAPKNKTST